VKAQLPVLTDAHRRLDSYLPQHVVREYSSSMGTAGALYDWQVCVRVCCSICLL
jgi:hypothetical protein